MNPSEQGQAKHSTGLEVSSGRSGLFGMVWGQGGPAGTVAMLHGLAASLHDWDRLGPALAAHGKAAWAIDLPGHGCSPKPEDRQEYHIGRIYERVAAWLDELAPGESIDMIGHSTGGYLSLLYAMRYPKRVRRLVLIDPLFAPWQIPAGLRWANRNPEFSSRVSRRTPLWLMYLVVTLDQRRGDRFGHAQRLQTAKDAQAVHPGIFYLPQSIADLRPHLTYVQQPAFVIWGADDPTLEPGSFAKLVRALPNATGRSVAHSGHQPHIGHAELVNGWITTFLA